MAPEHAADLQLARACLRGDPQAMRILEERVLEVAAALATIDASQAFVDEVLQRLRERLLVGDGARLAQYSGAGPLGAWLRVAAVRIAVDLRRGERREVPLEDQLAALSERASPEHQLASHQALERLRVAVREAFAEQPSSARALLRFHYSDGLGVEELGRLYRVHASTISRRLAQARAAILAATRSRLGGELDSVLGLAQGLELSVESLLRSQT